MKLSFKKTKLITVLLLGFYLLMMVCGFYCPMYTFFIVFVSITILNACLSFLYLLVGFFKEKLCVQLLN